MSSQILTVENQTLPVTQTDSNERCEPACRPIRNLAISGMTLITAIARILLWTVRVPAIVVVFITFGPIIAAMHITRWLHRQDQREADSWRTEMEDFDRF